MGSDNAQYSPNALVVHGLHVSSRHGMVYQLREMLAFVARLEGAGETAAVKAITYEASDCCHITLRPGLQHDDAAAAPVLRAAQATLSQFEWAGQVMHGRAAR